MTSKSDDKQVEFFAKSFKEVVLPALEDMEKRLASKKEVQELGKELGMKIDTLDRKFDAQRDRLDRHDKRITRLEEKAGFVTP
jgi:transcriptional regulator GlxA family with amidase domain